MLTPLKPAESKSPGVEKADAEGPARLLRAFRERPHSRAAQLRDELAAIIKKCIQKLL